MSAGFLRRRRVLVIAAALILLLALAFVFVGRHLLPEHSAFDRGQRVAERAGCFACHSNGAFDGEWNPPTGPEGGATRMPALTKAGLKPDDIRAWIREGSAGMSKARPNALIPMPAYKDVLSEAEIDDITVYLTLMQRREGGHPGEALARAQGCFTCHGEAGQGGVGNAGSLKGYIPGFFGDDFDILTEGGDPDVVREWIRDGISETFVRKAAFGLDAPRRILETQAIRMPAYGSVLSAEEIELLVGYCLDVRRRGEISAASLSALSQEPAASPAPDAATVPQVPPASEGLGDGFDAGIRPILERHCVGCHGADKSKSDYRLDARESAFAGGRIADSLGQAAVVPGDPSKSMLWLFVAAEDDDEDNDVYVMPPKDEYDLKLGDADKSRIRTWIEQGAPWPDGTVLKAKD